MLWKRDRVVNEDRKDTVYVVKTAHVNGEVTVKPQFAVTPHKDETDMFYRVDGVNYYDLPAIRCSRTKFHRVLALGGGYYCLALDRAN